MFALPQMISVPAFNFGVGGIDLSWVASVLAWTLFGALIVSVLGLLQSSSGWPHTGSSLQGAACSGIRYGVPLSAPSCRRRCEISAAADSAAVARTTRNEPPAFPMRL
jgi:hypothetical protein